MNLSNFWKLIDKGAAGDEKALVKLHADPRYLAVLCKAVREGGAYDPAWNAYKEIFKPRTPKPKPKRWCDVKDCPKYATHPKRKYSGALGHYEVVGSFCLEHFHSVLTST